MELEIEILAVKYMQKIKIGSPVTLIENDIEFKVKKFVLVTLSMLKHKVFLFM